MQFFSNGVIRYIQHLGFEIGGDHEGLLILLFLLLEVALVEAVLADVAPVTEEDERVVLAVLRPHWQQDWWWWWRWWWNDNNY